jgi:hypothetical protein
VYNVSVIGGIAIVLVYFVGVAESTGILLLGIAFFIGTFITVLAVMWPKVSLFFQIAQMGIGIHEIA